MSADWISTTVGEYSPFTYGKAIKKADQLNGRIPVYGSNGVYAFSAEALVKQHAVIIGRKGSVGKVHLSTKPCWISDTAFHTTKNTIEEAYFVYYLLSSLGLEDMNTDAAVPGLNRNNAHRLEIKIPNSVEGRIALVAPLITLDKKIELNRQTNQTLEHIAQALFKCWFVDFEPTRAKIIAKEKGANTAIQELAAQAIICGAMTLEKLEAITQNLETTLQQAINEKLSQVNQTPINTEQLKTTAALFPDALVDSELGEIPEGWEVLSISDFGKVITGKTPPKKIEQAYDNAGVPFITPTDIEDSVFLTSTNRFLTAEGQLAIKNTKIEAGTICVTCIGSQMGKAIVTPKDAFTNQQINSIAVYDDSFRNYLLLNLRNRREEIYDIGSSGSTMPIINKTTFEKLDVISPSLELLKRFDLVVEFNMKQILNGSLENIRLSDIRDLLLPQLLSGELLDSELVGGL